MTIRRVLADDHPVVLEGFVRVLSAERDFEVVAVAIDGDETLQASRRFLPDFMVLDLRMPGNDGLGRAARIAVRAAPNASGCSYGCR